MGDEADDVAQEVFVRLLDGHQPDRLLPWMYATSTNLCVDRLRHHRRRDAAWQGELERVIGDVPARQLDDILVSLDLCRRALLEVDARTQAVAILVYFDEMTQDEAADVLGVSRKTVNERLRRFTERARKLRTTWQS